MKPKSIGLMLVLLMMLAPFLMSYNMASSQSAVQYTAQSSALTSSSLSTIVVTSSADSGPGTLREALGNAESGDTIIFDPTVFPPNNPATIYLECMLPPVTQGNLLIDASNAGVILDGHNVSEEWPRGLELQSNDNIIWGLQVVNFSPGAGIALSGGAQNNMIGGDRNIGSGPTGQGNLIGYNEQGIRLCDAHTSFNTIMDNLIGTDPNGIEAWGNSSGVQIENGASHNIIGPDNMIAYNRFGITIMGSSSLRNTITQNSIHSNEVEGIELGEGSNNELAAPDILEIDLTAGTVTGTACANCVIEIFSDRSQQGRAYEGQAKADVGGVFTFSKGATLTGPNITVTATDTEGNTSEFSAPVFEGQVSGDTIVVSSTDDNGPGTLRQALESAQSGDTIIFDPVIFPPSAPATIYLRSYLPGIGQGNLTIDASNTGVILDGTNIAEAPGISINSNGNTIQGLQIINFSPGVGISLVNGAQNNTIGGKRSIGSGPLGQGNLISNNAFGIILSEDGTSFNTITGNLIGTDPTVTEDWGNELDGIWIGNGASHNIIGPNNVIAYNSHYGIHIGVDSERDSFNFPIGNNITGNSIHNNDLGGIKLWGDSNKRLEPPTILGFDLNSGTITGATSAGYTVEIFSDKNLQGQIYEGQTKADANGVFTLNKGASFAGPSLTVTTTDNEGNTSQFSAPMSGTSISIVLQEGNSLPRLQIQPKKSSELIDNRLGMMGPAYVQSDWGIENLIHKNITDIGYKWIRLSFDWFDWSEVAGGTGAYSKHEINPFEDKYITVLSNSGIKIICTLVFWDKAMDDKGYHGWFKTEEQIQRYLDYVQFIVHHFKGRIQYYEILNEPEIKEFGQQHVEVADYINLVRRTVPVIRQEDPEAKIVAGAIGDLHSHKDNMKYFFTIIESDIMPLVDAVSWHSGPSSPEYQANYYYDYPDLVQEIKDTASAHGFKGEYIIEELNWRTPKEHDPDRYTEYSELASAKYYVRGIIMNLGMDFTHVGIAFSPDKYDELPYTTRVIRNLSTIMAGTESISLALEIQSRGGSGLGCSCNSATNIRYYSFSLPNGDRLIALWIDSKAIDNYTGINTTLTVPDFSAQRVTGIDVLYSFEQELMTSFEDRDLVIENLIVRDCPIILRLTH